MKTQRRHELQTNVLADWLGRHIEQVKPYVKTILAVAIGLIAVLGLWQYLSTQQGSQVADGWRSYFAVQNEALRSQDPEALEQVAKSHDGTLAGLWALKRAADMELASGNQLLFRDRERANEALNRALELYTQLQSKGESHPMLLDRARLGAAQAQESLGQLSQAADLYTELGDSAGEKALAELARTRAEQLKLADTRRFYNWFGKQDPASALDQFMTPPRQAQLPDDLGTLSDRPDLSFPGFDPNADDARPDDTSTLDTQTTEPQTTEPQTTEPQTTEPQNTEPQTTEPQNTEPGAHEKGVDGAGAQDQVPEAPPLDERATLPQGDSDTGTQRPDPQQVEEESPNVSAGPDPSSP